MASKIPVGKEGRKEGRGESGNREWREGGKEMNERRKAGKVSISVVRALHCTRMRT